MMCRAQGCVGKTRTGPNDNNWDMVITHIHPDLFVTTIGGKWCNGITNRAETFVSQARRHADHVRFCDSAVVKAIGAIRFKVVEEAVADVCSEQHETRILLCELRQFRSESISHGKPNSSLA